MIKRKFAYICIAFVIVVSGVISQINISVNADVDEIIVDDKEPTFLDKEGNVISKDEGIEVENKKDVFTNKNSYRGLSIPNGVVNFNTKGDSRVNTSYVDINGNSGYTNGAYGADAAFLGYEQNGDKTKFMMAGVVGLVNTSEIEILDYDAMNSNQNSVSFYRVENGKLYHYVTTNIKSASWAGVNYVGPGPDSLVPNTVYYSYDGNYFYESYAKMIESYKNNPIDGNGSKNQNSPYYNYFQYLNMRSRSSISAAQFDSYVNARTTSNSKIRNLGAALTEYGNTYGVNPILALAIAINESGWGTSSIAMNKNNIFGLSAFDSSPGLSADTYSSPQNCVKQFMEHWMSKGYLMPKDYRAYGGGVGNKSAGINVKYASDPYWGEKAATNAWNISNSIMDESNRYSMGIKNSQSSINIRSQANTNSSVLYKSKANAGVSYIILDEVIGSVVDGSNIWYKIQSEAVLDSNRNQIVTTSGRYDFNKDYGYIHSSLIKKVGSVKSVCQLDDNNIPKDEGIIYQTNVESDCWQNWKKNGESSGTEGYNKRIEGIRIKLNGYNSNSSVNYRIHSKNVGWEEWKKNGEVAGKSIGGTQIEAIEIKLNNMPDYHIEYRAHVQDIGWQEWKADGELAGSVGKSKRIEAIQIKVVRNEGKPSISYQTHIQDFGWQSSKLDGETSGTLGQSKRLEGIKISLKDNEYGGGVEYSTHIQDIGWQSFKTDGNISGTTNQAKRLEAIKIKLYGEIEKLYDVYYRVHVQNFGWLDWAENGEMAGSAGYGYRLEGIEIKLIKKGEMKPGGNQSAYISNKVKYATHIQDIGWQNFKNNGELSGTSGKSLRLEGIKIQKVDDYLGDVIYRTHIQNIGWQDFKKNGEISGTNGKSLRLEAIEINLTDALSEKYDVYYRTHVENLGWLDWAKNGQSSGSEGYSYRLEGIEIRFIDKGGVAPGKTTNVFVKK